MVQYGHNHDTMCRISPLVTSSIRPYLLEAKRLDGHTPEEGNETGMLDTSVSIRDETPCRSDRDRDCRFAVKSPLVEDMRENLGTCD